MGVTDSALFPGAPGPSAEGDGKLPAFHPPPPPHTNTGRPTCHVVMDNIENTGGGGGLHTGVECVCVGGGADFYLLIFISYQQ